MSLLSSNTTPAERRRGCSFSDDFQSAARVVQNSGAVTGAPTFDNEGGVTLDGGADYLTYNLQGTEFDSDPISIVVEFTPDFDYDENVTRYLLDSPGGDRYSVYKRNTAGSHEIHIYLGDTFIGAVASATYSPSWAAGERHILVISGTTGDTDAWLINSAATTQILTADATAWTADTPATLYVGSNSAGTGWFDGTIHSVQIYKAKLTQGEAQDFYDETVYSYMDSVTALYQMRAEDHDPTGNKTLDSSGNNYDLTDVHDPVKLKRRGYDFDGTNDNFERTSDGVFSPGTKVSMVAFVMPKSLAGIDHIASKWTGAPDNGWILGRNGAAVRFWVSEDGTASDTMDKTNALAINRRSVIVITYDSSGGSGASVGNIYVDDLVVATDAAMDGPIHDSSYNFRIAGPTKWDGEMYYFAYFDGLILTPLQIEDLKIKLWKQLQDI